MHTCLDIAWHHPYVELDVFLRLVSLNFVYFDKDELKFMTFQFKFYQEIGYDIIT